MDDATFARQLSSWLDPFRLVSLSQQYIKNPGDLERQFIATREANSFSRASDVGLDRLVRIFLENFELPGEVLLLLPGASRVPLDDAALRRMSGLRFTGDVSFTNLDPSISGSTVVTFAGPAIEILAVAGPINFLIRLVDEFAGMWSVRERDRVFYEPAFHTELPTYIEACVATALGFRVDAAWTSGRQGQNIRPVNRVVTMVGSPPFDRGLGVAGWATALGRAVPPPRTVVERQNEAAFEERDGFLLLDASEAAKPWHNLERFRNESSPLSGVENPSPRRDGKLCVDSQYGRAFDFILTESSAVYGFTDDLAAVSPQSDLGYLRVPYRCVPRIRVGSRSEVNAIIDAIRSQPKPFADGRLLLRGQTQEYFLGRSAAASNALYGDSEALEPSLPASATRKGQALEAVLPQWCFLIRCYQMGLQLQMVNQLEPAQLQQLSASMASDRQRLEQTLDNQTIAFSLAQHYGLPSMGLDLTDRVDTALFFALHRFVTTDERKLQVMPSEGSSVLYLFLLPERFCVEYARARPRIFPRGRPDAQLAWFSHMGWGYRRNQCAEYLAAALYLEPGGDFGPLPRAEDLFPPAEEDPFGSLLEAVLAEQWASPTLRRYLEQLYWLER